MPTSLLLLLNLIRILQGETPAVGAEGAGADGPAGSEGAAEPPPSGTSWLLPMIGIFAVFYFVMIRPEKKNRKKREEMLGAIKKGDRVMTSSGMYGRVVTTGDDEVKLEIADGVRVDFNRAAIQTVITGDEKEKEKG